MTYIDTIRAAAHDTPCGRAVTIKLYVYPPNRPGGPKGFIEIERGESLAVNTAEEAAKVIRDAWLLMEEVK